MSFDWVCIYHAQDTLEANIIKGMLVNAGIQTQLKGEALQGALGEIPFLETQISVWVETIKQRQATDLLVEYQQNKQPAAPWFCQSCKQRNPAEFDLCWSCMKSNHDQTQ